MINNIKLAEKKIFDEIGLQVNSNFSKLFDLEYIINSSNEDVFGYYKDEILVGFIHVLRTFECLEIINIVVDKEHRQQGIAMKLIEYIIDYYENLEYILLEVNENNISAINLYKKMNFEVINVRKKYYGNEDALIMKRGVL